MRSIEEVRSELLSFVKNDLVGPAHGEAEVLEDQPRIRYAAGVLFPQESVINESGGSGGVEDGDDDSPRFGDGDSDEVLKEAESPEEDSGRKSEGGPESEHDESIALSNSYRPSAIGMSFMVSSANAKLTASASAAVYESGKKASEDGTREWPCWRRKALELPSFESFELVNEISKVDVELAEGLYLHVVCRPRPDGRYLVTTSLYNSTFDYSSKARTFFQVELNVRCTGDAADIVEYQAMDGLRDEAEELALAMLYRNRRVFGVGHGCAVTWDSPGGVNATKISTEVFPSVIVPPVVPLSGNQDYLSMQFLSGSCADPGTAIPEELRRFCAVYESWIEKKEAEIASLDNRFHGVAGEHMSLCRMALARMQSGIEHLQANGAALDAFMLVNRAMLMQQCHSKLRRELDDPWKPLPGDNEYLSIWTEKKKQGYWRAFQLAFVLMSITSFGEEDESLEIGEEFFPANEVVDLIWFPTGGGKTEAYLGVTAYVVILERLRGVDVPGCRVLMRYTLRLLTSQQFQRAASLICACEYIRRNDQEGRLGNTPITIGLWVGMSLTPNNVKDDIKKLSLLAKKKGDAKNPFQLLSCPWCGTELNNPKRWGYVEYRKRQIYLCPASDADGESRCPFSSRRAPLPVCAVDESIYENPPTMLIGTVDKFAMLAWREQAGNIFSQGGGPRLIIQDELHLITGPLGSMVGLYESVIDYLCSRTGRRPKIIASTATIRRADVQCRALYDRPMFQFPPPGLDVSDSFFAAEDRGNSPGRLYVGFLPTATSSPLTAQIRAVVSMQQGAFSVVDPDGSSESENLMDPYWTLVQYFGSLKELGRAATFITADIPEFLPTMYRRYGLVGDKRRWMNTSEELTSRKNEDEIPKILKRLEAKYKHDAMWEGQALDTVLATNMISVGVDVDRLGLMMVVTQPKGTAEYIQASSRVGRSNDAPGLILTLYNAGRPRDRSHYEQFRSYHDSFYRWVEPTSVTPYSPPAMERALHAVVVIAGRHIAGWGRPSDMDETDKEFREFLEFLRTRVEHIDPDHLLEYDSFLADRLDHWRQNSPDRWGDFSGMRDEPTLMRIAGSDASEDDPYSWPTPTSLRNVDVECSAQVIPRYARESEVES